MPLWSARTAVEACYYHRTLRAQWVIDAATCYIRDFKLIDHSTGYARMKSLDQRAIREEPAAWSLLTDGKATLQRKLIDILWSGPEFRSQQTELLDLLTRFGLAIPLPSRQDEYLIPALLPVAAAAVRPNRWPEPPPDAARLRIFFHLEGQALEDGMLLCDSSELTNGFLPIGVFHKLAAGALGCSQKTASGVEPSLDRQTAYIAFDDRTLVLLVYDAEESSIDVTLATPGRDGSAASVADRLRVLLFEELSAYVNLRYRMLVPVPGSSSTWVDLEELPKAGAVRGGVMLRGEQVGTEQLKEEFAFWLTTQCEFNFVLADKLREASEAELPTMVTLQELRRTKRSWLTTKLITFEATLSGAYSSDYLTLSYRWETAEHPGERHPPFSS